MTSATLAVLAGYLCIFMAHLPMQKFFGYDFKTGKWAEYKRVIHAWLGYTVLFFTVFQGAIGMLKMDSLRREDSKPKFRWHGNLGKAIILCGCLNVIIATRFWGWSVSMKAPVYAFTIMCGLFGAVYPRQDVTMSSEELPIVGK